MRICVLGGSGFIGTHLVRALLARGHAVSIFDRAPSPAFAPRVRIGDVRDAAAVRDGLQDCDLAIDLAAEHRDDVRPVSRYAEVNVGGARSITAAAAAHRITRLLFVSSVAVYGHGRPGADEVGPPAPDHPYGASKLAAEAIYRAWQAGDATRRSLQIVRPTAVFGEGHRGNLHRMIEQLHRGRFVLLDGGRNRKSIAYVGNLVDFLVTRLDAPPGIHCHNFADAPAPSMRELVEAILAERPAWRRPASLPYGLVLLAAAAVEAWAALRRRPATITRERVRRFRAETTIATEALFSTGFRPRYTLREGLQRTLAADDD
jgi:nucleoside-diphosphate-sugar epimerase